MKSFIYSLVLILCILSAYPLHAQIPQRISHQGFVSDSTGTPVNATLPMTFSLFYDSTSSIPPALFSESFDSVKITKGVYSLYLDVTGVEWGGTMWLETEINGHVLSPRTQIASVPYALQALSGGSGFSLPFSGSSNFAGQTFSVTNTNANGVAGHFRTNNPSGTNGSWALHAESNSPAVTLYSTNSSASAEAGWFEIMNAANNTPALYGSTNGSGFGVQGNSALGIGVYGTSTNNYGVAGQSTNGMGVYGNSTGDVGSFGYSVNAYGVKGESQTVEGIYGVAHATGKTGVYGFSDAGSTGYGVSGVSNSTLNGAGVSALGSGNAGFGVLAEATGLNGIGVQGKANNNIGSRGVYGTSTNGTGVYGHTDAVVVGASGVHGGNGSGLIGELGTTITYNASTYAVGVYGGISTPGQYAGFFDGDVHIGTLWTGDVHGGNWYSSLNMYTGNLFTTGGVSVGANLNVTGSKNFKIDHPLDPANKYLLHSCIESNQQINMYSGNTTTDAGGNANVTLPDYFEALNINYRYQLTVIGQFAQAIISNKIQANQFSIKTDKPNVEVSWQVTGVRNDAYTKAHPFQVEVEKTATERGKYLSPVELGQPESMSIYPRSSDVKTAGRNN